MKVYLDFEANAITQEIISIGAVSENGSTFYSLVRPHTKLDHKIKELTGISQEEAEIAPTVEQVMFHFWNWIYTTLDCAMEDFPKFYVFGHHDKNFVNASISLTQDIVTKSRLEMVRNAIEDVAQRVSKKFNSSSISLRSAYLTMRLTFNESTTQDHNALNDAAMLKWVWEHIDGYELPEGVTPIKVQKPNLYYGKKHQKKNIGTRLYDYPIDSPKYSIAIKAVGKNRKGLEKEWHFDNIKGAITLIHPKKFHNIKEKIIVMDQILHAIETGEKLEGKFFTAE